MTKIRTPNPEGGDKTSEFITLSSSGFPDPAHVNAGSKLHFVDTGEEYVQYGGMWEPDLRLARALETAHLI
jgi:hypothetical protein